MTFDQAVKIVLVHEGGYSLDPKDPGGETRFGISKRAYPMLDIKNLTMEAAIDIYKSDYWDSLAIDQMPPDIRLMVFDCAVNQGRTRAVRILQGALGVKQDGVLGAMTFLAFQETPIGVVLRNMALIRLNHYSALSTWSRFGAGWAKRLLQIVLESIEIV
jgi:lysozyme family protein